MNCSKQFSNGFVQGYGTSKPIRSGQSGIIRWNLCKTQMTSFIVFTWTIVSMHNTYNNVYDLEIYHFFDVFQVIPFKLKSFNSHD